MPVYPAPQPAPSQRTWAAGEYPTAAQFNTYFRDGIGFLQNPPACRVYRTTNQSVTTGAGQAVAFDAERYDTDNMHSTSVNTDRITFNTAGLYLVSGNGGWALSAGGSYRRIAIRLNGATYIAITQYRAGEANTGNELSIATTYKFAVNDYVQLIAEQDTGASLNLAAVAAFSPEFAATWIGLG